MEAESVFVFRRSGSVSTSFQFEPKQPTLRTRDAPLTGKSTLKLRAWSVLPSAG